jgi:hypothetical protein
MVFESILFPLILFWYNPPIMAIFTSEQAFYRATQTLFDAMRANTPNPIDQLAAQKLLIRLRFSSPSAVITVNGRRSPVGVQYGTPTQPAIARPDLEAEMAADTLHLILLDTLSLKSALANKQMKVSGALWKTNSLGEILDRGRLLYPEIARHLGLLKPPA